MKRISLIVGARPNFVKAGPLYKELEKEPAFQVEILHTGQHYDVNMSDIFFKQLDLPAPHVNLNVGSGPHGKQTGEMLIKIEKHYLDKRPDLVVVFGDTNSTLAGALVAAKMGIKVAHIEAGVRSFDMSMPEEINRIIVDRISDLLFIPDEYARLNLNEEGISTSRMFLVGNILMDTLSQHMNKIIAMEKEVLDKLDLASKAYGLITIHRAGNVDDIERLRNIITIIKKASEKTPLVFPVHPRTQSRLSELGYIPSNNVKLINPLGYLEFIALLKNSLFVMTDSGGVQTESSFLQVPCLTLRENTEWLITLSMGTNVLVAYNIEKIEEEINKIIETNKIKGPCIQVNTIKYWDGKTSERIVNVIKESFEGDIV
ncbi:MAG TPA: UDP-N-acetylglucosamine 2-epimerase (non-hydrolyzing) [Candidatus Hydrothermia bacterium]|nr:UDP-N-acetylglucosamine 2-epimerase (non-hydrolyzing) [Candidatus Hydrothermia bacterium]